MSKHTKEDSEKSTAAAKESATAPAAPAATPDAPEATATTADVPSGVDSNPTFLPPQKREYVRTLPPEPGRVGITLTDRNRRPVHLIEIDGPAPFRIAHAGVTYERFGEDPDTGDVCYCQI